MCTRMRKILHRYQFGPTGGPPVTGPPQSDFGDLGRPDQVRFTSAGKLSLRTLLERFSDCAEI